LNTRFEKNINRHKVIEWALVKAKVQASSGKLLYLNEMESTGEEPSSLS
jgi:hypothetical protein